jgi:ectoine hydroxylase-related dioxygenase (phytanoyl-CoA dioxygenase family)
MDEYEKYLFDLNGYLVLEDVLTPEEVAACNEAIDQNQDRVQRRPSDRARSRGSEALQGKVRGDLLGMLVWPKPWCQPFRDLLSHPRIMACLLELIGEGFRLDHLYGIVMDKGTEGHRLHGAKANSFFNFYGFINGRIRCGVVVVSWVLTDCGPGTGGFMVIPGSHKSNFPLPRDLDRLQSELGLARQVEAKAGSVIIFPEALAHGALPWRADHQRRSMLYKYAPGPLVHNAPDAFEDPGYTTDTKSYRPEGVEEVMDEFTPLQRALLEPPYYPKRPSISEYLANG